MSRFLEYGVFVPNESSTKESPSPSSTGQWAQVGGKWMKVGPDGQPIVPPTSSLQSTQETISVDVLQGGGVREGSGGIEGSDGSAEGDPLFPSMGAEGNSDDGGGSSSGESGEGQEETPLGTTKDEDIDVDLDSCRNYDKGNDDADDGNDDDGGGHSEGGGNEEDGDNKADGTTAMASRMYDSNNSSSAGSAAPRPRSMRSRGPEDYRNATGGLASSEEQGTEKDDNEDDGEEGASPRAAGLEEGGEGVLTLVTNGEGEGAETDAGGSLRSQMLTPGLSRSYSADEIVDKFFGADAGSVLGSGSAAGTPNAVTAASGGNTFASSGENSGVACVGERAAPSSGKGRGTENAKGKSRKSSNSPPAEPVETRDVACQWDGSEMGDDEEEFTEVELPDTPDCRALTAVLRLYDHARSENKRMGVLSSRPGWGVEENIENWDGVYLDTDDRVVALDVDGDPENRQAVLIGPLPVELSGMDHLEQLTMRRHRFKGRIPAELGQLSRLTHLNLSNCRLIGFIPPSFGDLVNLVVLNLSWNFLSGDLPPELSKLSNLEELLLNSNAFSGAIPPEFGKLRKLQRFSLGHNIGVSGTLPPEMCRMSSLTLLDLRHNKISGKIPPLFGRLTNLQQLWLQNNELTDEIPAELARLPKLQMLHLGNNKLAGVIPMALRGHPRYRAFKILPGNFALGEKVAPTEKEVEAASRRKPSMNAMEHASGALAQSQQQKQARMQQRRDSSSISPTPPGSYVGPDGTDGKHVTGPPRSTNDVPRSSTGRGSMGRKFRSMKRVMGKKSTPPTSPTGSTGTTGSKSPTAAGGGPLLTVLGQNGGSGGERVGPDGGKRGNGSEKHSALETHTQGKAFLEVMEAGETGGDGGSASGDASPDPTASTDTGTSGYTSPSSQKSTGGGSGGGSGVAQGDGDLPGTSSYNAA